MMREQRRPLISPSLGTQRELTSYHFGTPRAEAGQGEKIYIQASLHADELPGMLTAWHLKRRLLALEAEGRLQSEIVLVPVANPIGLNQHVNGSHLGRFELASSENFNRNYLDFAPLIADELATRLTDDAERNKQLIRAAMERALAAQQPETELGSLRHAIMSHAFDADVVLDLHCDWEAVMHLYTGTPLWPEVEPLARYLGSHASLLATESGGEPFDEASSQTWWKLVERFGDRHPIPYGCISVTVELRSQHEVSHELAEHDADAIIQFLIHRGAIAGTPAPMPGLPHPATPLAGSEPVKTPVSGVLVHRVPLGAVVNAGDLVAEVINPWTDEVTALHTQNGGVVYARHYLRFVTAGMSVLRVAGAKAFRSGYLLSA